MLPCNNNNDGVKSYKASTEIKNENRSRSKGKEFRMTI